MRPIITTPLRGILLAIASGVVLWAMILTALVVVL
jgi:hypothetical protein